MATDEPSIHPVGRLARPKLHEGGRRRVLVDERAHVVPALIRKCVEQDTIYVLGTGRERREFIYVKDVVRGMLAALESGKAGRAYNLGTGGATSISILELLLNLKRLLGVPDKPHQFYHAHDPGDDERWSDASRAGIELGWEYRVGLDEGLRRTVECYKETLTST